MNSSRVALLFSLLFLPVASQLNAGKEVKFMKELVDDVWTQVLVPQAQGLRDGAQRIGRGAVNLPKFAAEHPRDLAYGTVCSLLAVGSVASVYTYLSAPSIGAIKTSCENGVDGSKGSFLRDVEACKCIYDSLAGSKPFSVPMSSGLTCELLTQGKDDFLLVK